MAMLDWKDSYSVGNAHLDAQHKGRGSPVLCDSVQGYLKVWLTNHILFADRAYSRYVKQSGGAAARSRSRG